AVVAARALDDGGADAHVGEALEPLDEDVDQRHQAEYLGHEQAREDQVDREADDLGQAVTGGGPDGALDGAAAEGALGADVFRGRALAWGRAGRRGAAA